jgi:hypothetical protein
MISWRHVTTDKPFKVAIDQNNEVITIEGVKYAFSLFRVMATAPLGAQFEIVERSDGVVSLKTIWPQEQG